MTESSETDEAGVRENAMALILPGFSTLEEVHAIVAELADDEASAPDPHRVRAIVEEIWAQRLVEQRTWRGLSDADRVAAAFGELNTAGVIARMCFTCCQSCGMSEIGDEVPDGATPQGFVFFHQQDAERLAGPDAHLYLAYGAFCDPDASDVERDRRGEEIGRQVQRSLEAHGLQVEWNGSINQRIHLPGLDWRARLPI